MKKLYFTAVLIFIVLSGKGGVITSSSLPSFEYIYCPDSIVTYYVDNNPTRKTSRTYNSDDKCIERILYNWDKEKAWIPDFKYRYEYSLNTPEGKHSLFENYQWNSNSNDWQASAKVVSQYNDFGYETSMETYAWNIIQSIWHGQNKDTVYYDNSHQVIKIESYSWDKNNNAWMLTPKSTTIYYRYNNERLDSIVYNYNEYKDKQVYSYYEGSNNIKTTEYFQQVADSGIWSPVSKVIYTYDSHDNIIKSENLKITNGEWVNTSLYNYDWDNDGREILYEYYKWNAGNNKWKGESKQISEYSDNYSIFIKYKWSDIVNNDWQKSTKAVHTYNLNQQHISYEVFNYLFDIDLITLIQRESYKESYFYDTNSKLSKIEIYGNDHTSLTAYEIYYYSNSPQSIDKENNNSGALVYYIGSSLIIDSPFAETVDIYSISGRLISKQNKESGKTTLNIGRQAEPIVVKGDSGWVKKLY